MIAGVAQTNFLGKRFQLGVDMKNGRGVIHILVLLLVLAGTSYGQLEDGLTAYYEFENDFSTSAGTVDGTPVNGPFAGASGGIAGNAMLMNPEIVLSPSINVAIGFGDIGNPVDLGQSFTISAWYNLVEDPMGSASNRYFVYESETSFDVSYGLRDLGLGTPGINDGQVFTGTGDNFGVEDAGLPGWHHVLQVYSSDEVDTLISTYVDGVLLSETILASSAGIFDTGLNFGAARSSVTDRGFEGLIDEVALWDRELSPTEIQDVYNSGLGEMSLLGGGLENGMVAYYEFESDFSTSIGNVDATPLQGAVAGATGGIVGNAMMLIPAMSLENQHMNVQIGFGDVGNPVDLGQTFTVSAWYNLVEDPMGSSSNRYFVFESETSFDVSYGTRDLGLGVPGINDGQVFTGSGDNFGVEDAALPGWHHVLQVYSSDRVDTLISTYIDGVLLGDTITASSAGIFDSGLNFGAARNSQTNRGFEGLIDEVAIWDRELSPTEIGEVYNAGLNGESLLGAVLLGDVNCDGAVDLLDVGPFVDLLTTGGFSDKADVNEDGAVDLLDVGPFVDLISGG